MKFSNNQRGESKKRKHSIRNSLFVDFIIVPRLSALPLVGLFNSLLISSRAGKSLLGLIHQNVCYILHLGLSSHVAAQGLYYIHLH